MFQVPSDEPRSSCEISTSTRGFDIKVKVYGSPGAPVGAAVDECITEWLRARAELERRLMGELAA